jgi:hypothetical protein
MQKTLSQLRVATGGISAGGSVSVLTRPVLLRARLGAMMKRLIAWQAVYSFRGTVFRRFFFLQGCYCKRPCFLPGTVNSPAPCYSYNKSFPMKII